MSNSINLSINLEELSSNQVKTLSAFIHSFDRKEVQDHPVTQAVDEVTTTIKEEPLKKTRASKKNTTVQEGAFKGQERTESHVDDYEAAKETEVNEPTDADDDFLGGGEKVYTRDEIRTAAAPLMSDHRQALKDKIKELGADSLINLEESKFPAFMLFIDSLK